ncbi:hypothetical protein ACHAWT_010432 [Skeletonema menzelii]
MARTMRMVVTKLLCQRGGVWLIRLNGMVVSNMPWSFMVAFHLIPSKWLRVDQSMKTTCTFLAAPATSARNVATVSARVVTEKNNLVKWIPAVVAVDPQEAEAVPVPNQPPPAVMLFFAISKKKNDLMVTSNNHISRKKALISVLLVIFTSNLVGFKSACCFLCVCTCLFMVVVVGGL